MNTWTQYRYEGPSAPGTLFALAVAVCASLVLFGALAWFNRRALTTADDRIAAARAVELQRPRRKQPRRRPQPPEPKVHRQTARPRERLRVRRPQRTRLDRRHRRLAPAAVPLELDLRTLALDVSADLALPPLTPAPPDDGPAAGAGAPLPERLYRLQEVAHPPVRTRYVKPRYPARALRRERQGRVEVEFTVAVDGTVEDARAQHGRGRGDFEEAALRAVRQWRFRPGRRADDEPVPVRCVVTVEFKLHE